MIIKTLVLRLAIIAFLAFIALQWYIGHQKTKEMIQKAEQKHESLKRQNSMLKKEIQGKKKVFAKKVQETRTKDIGDYQWKLEGGVFSWKLKANKDN